MPIFSPPYYRSQCRGRLNCVNSLLHYVWVGRYQGLSPSPWFDVEFYLSHNKDVARSGKDPLLHYLRQGGLEGRSPCEQFDAALYLRDNQDVGAGRINPLVHYISYGRNEGRQIHPVISHARNPGQVTMTEAFHPSLPSEKCWNGLASRASIDQALIDVVVPVYKGRTETLNCLYSVLAAATDIPYELIVMDDASPDIDLIDDLQCLARQGLFTLLTNTTNLGFVETANRGMELHADRDVVLLNSDTEVYDGWLDRLQQAAQRNNRTATVTPLSNNATICSYPRTLHDNPYPLELSYQELDALASTVNAGVEIEVPTAVGFCMYIKRDCLNQIGLLDVAQFGRGYGEENDLSQRAIKKRWRNIIAADVFVRHWGATSFQGEKGKRVQSALKIMERLHPDYNRDITDFIAKDPLLEYRQRLDWARLRCMSKKKNVLIVNHNRGGGSERHVQEDVETLTRGGYGVFMLRPKPGHPSSVILRHPIVKSLPNLPSFALNETLALKNVLNDLAISEIHTHSLVDLLAEAPDHLTDLVNATGVRWEINLHDYKVICPRINLVNGSGHYCEERSVRLCNQCLAEQGSDFGVNDIEVWRTMHRRALLLADTVLVPDQDVADRLKNYFAGVQFIVSPHEDLDLSTISIRKSHMAVNQRLSVVIIGAIGKIKGFDVLLACARDARRRKLPIDFIVLGYSMNDRLLQESGVRITGRYLEEDAQRRLSELSPHAVWLPSVWPETYSYTLSIAQQAGLPVFSFDIGAISRRVREYDPDASDRLSPLNWGDNPALINDRFVDFRSSCIVADVSNG